MKDRVIILGSGTCVPSLKRNPCAALMETGGSQILFDCGPGIMRRLLEAGTTIFDISVICLSHFHPDHSGELASLLFSSKYAGGKGRQEPLTLVAGKGFGEFFENLKGLYGEWVSLDPSLFRVLELDNQGPDKCSLKGCEIQTIPTVHNPESIGFRVNTASGASFVYSGDTDTSQNLVELAHNADLFLCECAHPDHLKLKGHLTPSLAGDMATRARVKKLVLTHFYPECENADIEAQCRKRYAGPLILAEDLMRLNVK